MTRIPTMIMVLVLSAAVVAQEPPSTTRLVPVSGVLTDGAGAPLGGPQTVTFSLFDAQTGGTPLWSETQLVTADERGRYTAYLGAGVPLPLDIFRTDQARWLETAVGGAGQPRAMLVAVPYALKAADAETVGGKPASAFVLAPEPTGGGTVATPAAAAEASLTSGNPGFIGMFTTETDLGNSVMFQNAFKIGVNTGLPEALFHVRGETPPAALVDVFSNDLGALPLIYRAARGTPNAPQPVQVNDILGGLAVRGYAPSGFTPGKGQIMFRAAENWTDTANGTILQFTTTPIGSTTFAERMRIDALGRVLVNNTTPMPFTHQMDVFSSTGNALWGRTSADGFYAVVGDASNTGGGGNGVIGQSLTGVGVTATSSTGRGLAVSSGGDVIASFSGSGKVGIGTTGPLDKLDVRGDIRTGVAGTGCVKDGDGTVIAGVCSSDRRLKNGITPFARSLDAVARLQPVHFTWRAEEFPDRHFGQARSFGLIAQDVEAVLPDLVTTDAEGYKAVKYNQLPLYMLQAMKELKAENDALKQQLKMQEERLRRLEQLAGR